jgi:hypothetical protein
MNNRTTYEQLIADKLQQLPIPDMADAIWARIEQQLNVEMPVDDQGPNNTPGSSSPGFRFPGNTMLYIFIAALTTIYFLSKSFVTKQGKDQTSTEVYLDQTDSTNANIKEELSNDTHAIKSRDDKADISVPEAMLNVQQEPVKKEVGVNATEEATTTNAIIEKPMPQIQTQNFKPLVSQNTDTIPTKKGRGVKLNPNEYRIAPVKKDSLPE